MRIALYERATDATARSVDVTWQELSQELITHDKRLTKDGPAWSPVEIEDGGRRRNENVKAVTALVLDVDHTRAETVAAIKVTLKGLAYVIHSTFSSQHPDGEWAVRVILPLSRALTPDEYQTVRDGFLALTQIPADPATKDLSRLYYLPSCPPDRKPIAKRHHGETLDVNHFLGWAAPTEVSHRGEL